MQETFRHQSRTGRAWNAAEEVVRRTQLHSRFQSSFKKLSRVPCCRDGVGGGRRGHLGSSLEEGGVLRERIWGLGMERDPLAEESVVTLSEDRTRRERTTKLIGGRKGTQRKIKRMLYMSGECRTGRRLDSSKGDFIRG